MGNLPAKQLPSKAPGWLCFAIFCALVIFLSEGAVVCVAQEAQLLDSASFHWPGTPAALGNDNKARMDDIAGVAQRYSDARIVIIGYADGEHKAVLGKMVTPEYLAALRAVNLKAYLLNQKGLSPETVVVLRGVGKHMTADIYLVPRGVPFAPANTHLVDETKIRPLDTASLSEQGYR